MTRRARLLVPVLLLFVSALLLWIASRMTWLDVVTFNDQSGEIARSLLGTDWQPALMPVALGAVAAVAAVALVRGVGARAVGGVIALLGVAAGGLMLSGLGEPDADRAHAVVTGEQEIGRTDAGPGAGGTQRVPEWSHVTDLTTHPFGPLLTGAGALTLIGAGIVVVARPPHRVRKDDRYMTPAARRDAQKDAVPAAGERAESEADSAASGDSGRDLWQELDEGRDPTA